MPEPVFFETAGAFRDWLEANHLTATEVVVGFYRKASGRKSLTWPEAVDQALCFGWIDSIRRSAGDDAYTNRFTPRRATTTWSAVNIKRATELAAAGLMRPAGLAAFEARKESRSAIYSYEQQRAGLSDAFVAKFRAQPRAWEYFEAQPPGYRRTASWWVMSAKRIETRERRLATLIEDSANGRRLAAVSRPQP